MSKETAKKASTSTEKIANLKYPLNYEDWDYTMQACFMIGVDAGHATIHDSKYPAKQIETILEWQSTYGIRFSPEIARDLVKRLNYDRPKSAINE